MMYWDYEDNDDYSIYLYDEKVFEIGLLITDFLDNLWKNKDTKIIKRLYVYKDEVLRSKADLMEYAIINRKVEKVE